MDITSYLLGKQAGGGTPTVLEEKNVTVTTNGESEITPSEGYNGISKVNLTTNVPAGITPTGTINITQNGTVDVTTYASASVNVPSEKYKPYYLYRPFTGYNKTQANLNSDLNGMDGVNLTDFSYMFYNITSNNIQTINISSWDLSHSTIFTSMFDGCTKVKTINLGNIGSNVQFLNFANMFSNCSNLTTLTIANCSVTGNSLGCYGMFNNCSKLTSIDLSCINTTIGNLGNMFYGCSQLQHIDLRNASAKAIASPTNTLTNVPTTCEIIVKDADEKAWWNSKFPSYTNVKTVDEL